jgi:hypothetical protein
VTPTPPPFDVEALRKLANQNGWNAVFEGLRPYQDALCQAANEIEALRAKLAEAEEAHRENSVLLDVAEYAEDHENCDYMPNGFLEAIREWKAFKGRRIRNDPR